MEIRYQIVVRDADGSEIETEYAFGNTPRTARAAAAALSRQLAGFYPEATITVTRDRA